MIRISSQRKSADNWSNQKDKMVSRTPQPHLSKRNASSEGDTKQKIKSVVIHLNHPTSEKYECRQSNAKDRKSSSNELCDWKRSIMNSNHNMARVHLTMKKNEIETSDDYSSSTSSSDNASMEMSHHFRISPEKWQGLLTKGVPAFITISSQPSSGNAVSDFSVSSSSSSSSASASFAYSSTHEMKAKKDHQLSPHHARKLWVRIFSSRTSTRSSGRSNNIGM